MSESWERMERLLAWRTEEMKPERRKRGQRDFNGCKIPDGKAQKK